MVPHRRSRPPRPILLPSDICLRILGRRPYRLHSASARTLTQGFRAFLLRNSSSANRLNGTAHQSRHQFLALCARSPILSSSPNRRRRPAASPGRPAHATTRPPAIATTAPSIPESSDGIESHRRTQQNKFNKRNVITPIISTIPITLISPIIPITPIIPIK